LAAENCCGGGERGDGRAALGEERDFWYGPEEYVE